MGGWLRVMTTFTVKLFKEVTEVVKIAKAHVRCRP